MSKNFNTIFDEEPDAKFFFNDERYSSPILVDGVVSLEHAKRRMAKREYYALVTYLEGEELPQGYRQIEFADQDVPADVNFATITNDVHIWALSRNGGVQMVTDLSAKGEMPRYLLGRGPETVELTTMIQSCMDEYKKSIETTMHM